MTFSIKAFPAGDHSYAPKPPAPSSLFTLYLPMCSIVLDGLFRIVTLGAKVIRGKVGKINGGKPNWLVNA